MRRLLILLTLVIVAMLFAGTGVVLAQQAESDPSQSSSEEDFAAGELLVKFEEGTSKAKKEEAHKQKGGKTKEVIGGIDVEVVAVERGKEKSKAKDYQNDPNVKYAEVNGVYEAVATTPNDPRIDAQWQYNNTQYTEAKRGDIDAYEAWNGGTTAWDGGTIGSSSVAIAILDTGIKEDHEDLQGKVTKRINFTSSDATDTDDRRGHGTHVAGSAAAVTDNDTGVAGTCPDCSLYNVKVLGDTGSGYTSWIANGIIWAADNGAKVINMSLGGSSPSSTQQDVINYAWSKGVIVVAAAGNGNTSAQFYPAAYPNVIAVGATDNTDAKANFSNYGSSWVDVAAPGVSILSTVIDDPNTSNVEVYGTKNGTSMASPHVAGVAGLVWSKAGLCANNACVRNQLESKADQIGGTGSYWAKGRINANGSATTLSVAQTSPPPGAVGVARSTNITATFSEEMDKSTLVTDQSTLDATGQTISTSSTVKLYERVRKKIRRHGKVRRVWRWVPITATQVSCKDDPCRTVTLDPYGTSETLLDPYRSHLVVISTGVKDKQGNALAQEYRWTFTTGTS